MVRRLDPEESALWRRVAATVRPLTGHPGSAPPAEQPPKAQAATPATPAVRHVRAPSPPVLQPQMASLDRRTLDGGWDRRLISGRTHPERTVDLHGLTLAEAHAVVEEEVMRAHQDGIRLLLLITGRPPRPGRDGETRRGLIRGQVMHWLSSGSLGGRIAAVRPAHPRHGGAGALYLILRRERQATFP